MLVTCGAKLADVAKKINIAMLFSKVFWHSVFCVQFGDTKCVFDPLHFLLLHASVPASLNSFFIHMEHL
jgi:hypothetical protein